MPKNDPRAFRVEHLIERARQRFTKVATSSSDIPRCVRLQRRVMRLKALRSPDVVAALDAQCLMRVRAS